MKHAALLMMCSLSILNLTVSAARAEGTYTPDTPSGDTVSSDTYGADAPKAAVHRRKPTKKPVLPAAPIPYSAYTQGRTSGMNHAKLAPLPPPIAVTTVPMTAPPSQTPLPVQDMRAPPPPVPEAAPPAPPPSPLQDISLRCETRVTQNNRVISHGSFYIDLFPSPVFPDQQADFKFLFADPGHSSLIRQSVCLDTTCSAEVSGTAYYLVNRRTRHGDALRITLDRANGAFYAEQVDKNLTGGAHMGEQGICTPQKLPAVLF